jgi:hypothetical protein
MKNAVKYKAAPCLLTLFHDGLDVPDDVHMKIAPYGDLQYELQKTLELGSL